HTEGLDGVGGLGHLAFEVGVGEVAVVPGFAFEMDGHLVTPAGLDVPVHGVVGGVQRAVGEPFGLRRLGVVQGFGEGLVPGQEFACLLSPESQPVRLGALIQLRLGVRIGGELGTGRKRARLAEQILQCRIVVGHSSSEPLPWSMYLSSLCLFGAIWSLSGMCCDATQGVATAQLMVVCAVAGVCGWSWPRRAIGWTIR